MKIKKRKNKSITTDNNKKNAIEHKISRKWQTIWRTDERKKKQQRVFAAQLVV